MLTNIFTLESAKILNVKSVLYFTKMDTYTDLQIKKVQFKLIDANTRILQLDNMIGDKVDIPTTFPVGTDLQSFCQQATTAQLEATNYKNWNVNTLSPDGLKNLFSGNTQVQSLDLSKWNISKCADFSEMFEGCTQLQTINLSNWSLQQNNIVLTSMFEGCTQLQTINLSNWSVNSNATLVNITNWFKGCTQLVTIDVAGANFTDNASIYSGGTTAFTNGPNTLTIHYGVDVNEIFATLMSAGYTAQSTSPDTNGNIQYTKT